MLKGWLSVALLALLPSIAVGQNKLYGPNEDGVTRSVISVPVPPDETYTYQSCITRVGANGLTYSCDEFVIVELYYTIRAPGADFTYLDSVLLSPTNGAVVNLPELSGSDLPLEDFVWDARVRMYDVGLLHLLSELQYDVDPSQ